MFHLYWRNVDTANNTFPKVQTAETHAHQSSRGGKLRYFAVRLPSNLGMLGQLTASAKGPGNTHNSHQQHKGKPR